MKKKFTLFLALAIAFFISPFAHQTISADAKVYDNIKDGEYQITAKALNKDTGEASGAAGFISEDAKLTIKDSAAQLTITIPNDEGFKIKGLQIEGVEPTVTEGAGVTHHTYKLAELKSLLNAQVQYEVPAANIDHDVPLQFLLEGLDGLETNEEVIEEEELEEGKEEEADEPEDSRVEGTLVQDADEVYSVNYIVSTPMIERYFDNPVTLLKKDDKQYIQISGNSAQFIKSLTVNGEEVTWGKIQDDNTYIVQFELPSALTDELDFGMTIDTGNPQFGEMTHNVSLSFDPDSQKLVSGSEEPEEKEEAEQPEEEIEKPIEQPKEETKQDDLAKLTPDKAYEIDYVIKQENGSANSVANDFFVKPALLLEKDGNKYVQLTISNDMVKELENKYGEALVVRNNADGSVVVQLKVDDDLADMLLHMRVVVPAMPGFPGYDTEHNALLVFDQNSIKEIAVNDHLLVGTSDANNESGPTVTDGATPVKPAFGDAKEEAVATTTATTSQAGEANPQTGDTTSIMLYAMLLVGSLIPLVIKARRRFV